jgi:hypothetical protein
VYFVFGDKKLSVFVYVFVRRFNGDAWFSQKS